MRATERSLYLLLFLGSSTGKTAGDGVLELSRQDGALGVVGRAWRGGSYLQICDSAGKAKNTLR